MNAICMTLHMPSLNTVKNCREMIKYYAELKLGTINIPALRADLSMLVNYLSQTDQNANDVLVKVVNVMKTTDIDAALEDLGGLEGDVLTAYKRDLGTTLESKRNTLIGLSNELSKSAHEIKTMNYTTNTFRKQELETTRANLQAISLVEKGELFYDVMLQKKAGVGYFN